MGDFGRNVALTQQLNSENAPLFEATTHLSDNKRSHTCLNPGVIAKRFFVRGKKTHLEKTMLSTFGQT